MKLLRFWELPTEELKLSQNKKVMLRKHHQSTFMETQPMTCSPISNINRHSSTRPSTWETRKKISSCAIWLPKHSTSITIPVSQPLTMHSKRFQLLSKVVSESFWIRIWQARNLKALKKMKEAVLLEHLTSKTTISSWEHDQKISELIEKNKF